MSLAWGGGTTGCAGTAVLLLPGGPASCRNLHPRPLGFPTDKIGLLQGPAKGTRPWALKFCTMCLKLKGIDLFWAESCLNPDGRCTVLSATISWRCCPQRGWELMRKGRVICVPRGSDSGGRKGANKRCPGSLYSPEWLLCLPQDDSRIVCPFERKKFWHANSLRNTQPNKWMAMEELRRKGCVSLKGPQQKGGGSEAGPLGL